MGRGSQNADVLVVLVLYCTQSQSLYDFQCNFFSAGGSIICVNLGYHNAIRISLAVMMQFFNIYRYIVTALQITGKLTIHSMWNTFHVIMSSCNLCKYSDIYVIVIFNSSPPGQNGRHFADDIFKSIFMNEKSCTFIKISMKFVPRGPIDDNPALV